jgi:cysteine-rich repeat protein
VPCSDGCLSCSSQSACLQCRPEFTYNWAALRCQEVCGDGLRFSLSCDDGNNLSGDGCSSDCRIETNYVCYGGSPNSADYCTQIRPAQLTLSLTGTSHLSGAIILNVRSNYLPANLSDPAVACADLCQQLLNVSIVQGDKAVSSVKIQYFPGTFSFSVSLNFGREPIGQFTVRVGVDPNVASVFFPDIESSSVASFSVTPAFLTVYTPPDTLQ